MAFFGGRMASLFCMHGAFLAAGVGGIGVGSLLFIYSFKHGGWGGSVCMIDCLELGRREASGNVINSYKRCSWTVDGAVNGSHLIRQAE